MPGPNTLECAALQRSDERTGEGHKDLRVLPVASQSEANRLRCGDEADEISFLDEDESILGIFPRKSQRRPKHPHHR